MSDVGVNTWYFIASWIIYYFFHSFLALEHTKEKFSWIKNYRFWYSTISTIGLLPILYFGRAMDSTFYFSRSWLIVIFGFVVIALGLWVIKLAFNPFSWMEFLGLKNKEGEGELFVSGIHSKVRHPIYSGTIMIFLGALVILPNVAATLSFVILMVYLPIGIRLEEKRLIAQYGTKYTKYKQEVPSLVPKLFL